MSDLQCPATFLLVPSDAGPAALAGVLAHDRVAGVVTAPEPAASGLAEALAVAWGLPAPTPTPLDAATYRTVLAGLADLRRGETTVVVVEPELLGVVAGRAAPGLVEVSVDSAGLLVRDRTVPAGDA